jgi:hypothetical protein
MLGLRSGWPLARLISAATLPEAMPDNREPTMPDTSTEFNQALDTALCDPELQHDVDRRHLEPSFGRGSGGQHSARATADLINAS